ncbi:MAG: GTPase [Planctomycetota bacterium]
MSPRFAWLTPDVPAALALLRLTGPVADLRGVLGRLPGNGCALRTPVYGHDGALLDDAVAIASQSAARDAPRALLLCIHGGAGLRRALERCLRARGFAADTPDLDARWHALAQCPSPAARDWVLAHPHGRPEFDPELLVAPAVVLITGPTNVGKSSLLNAWCGHRRALAGPVPGTTRDLVSAVVTHRGWSFELVDSAGLREQGDSLEQAGQALAEAARASADAVLELVPPGTEPPMLVGATARRTLQLAAKADLSGTSNTLPVRWAAPEHVSAATVSAMLERIGDALLALLGLPQDPVAGARGLSADGGA